MTYPPELQAYHYAHDQMMDRSRDEEWWFEAATWGVYKFARYNAVKAGYLPETPEFG